MTKHQLATAVCEALRKERVLQLDIPADYFETASHGVSLDATDAALSAWSAAPDETDELKAERDRLISLIRDMSVTAGWSRNETFPPSIQSEVDAVLAKYPEAACP